jgi:hypothetical protein
MTNNTVLKTHVAKLTPVADRRPEPVTVDDAARLRELRALVEVNNRSVLSTDLIICQIWTESRFDARAGVNKHDAQGLMQVQRDGVKQVFKYRKQKALGRMPSDKDAHTAFAEGAAVYDSGQILDEATNIQIGTEYLQYWIDTLGSIPDGYKGYRGVGNGEYYRKISTCAEALAANPNSMQALREKIGK